MSYSLPDIATRDKPFRPILPNAVDEQAYLRLLTPVLQEWRNSAARSMNAYVLAQATGELTGLDEEDRDTAALVAALLALINWSGFFERVETWHRGKWVASVAHATGVDAKWMTQAPGVVVGSFAPRSVTTASSGVVQAAKEAASIARQVSTTSGITNAVSQAVASAKSLAASLSEEARARNRQAIIGGLRRGAPATEVARDVNAGLVKSKKRAVGIAENELDNFLKAATKARMAEAGLDFGKWRHQPQRNPRLHHLARDGKLYRAGDPILNEMLLPNCKCTYVPVLRIGKFSGI